MRYRGPGAFAHAQGDAVGVLVANLGTPAAPTAAALRPYLRQFLSDPRVIELPAWKWRPILELFVLTRRPAVSAALYRQVWTAEGSPLLVGTERLARRLEERLRRELDDGLHVAVAMRYGEPSVAAALARLADLGCRRLLVLPLYPQYSATTTGSTFDAVFAELARWRWVPELRTVASYHDDAGYVAALARSIRELWARDGESERLLLSFHGIPRRYFVAGDPYYCQCQKTARLVAAELALPADRLLVTFQSLFGKEEWLQPYTDETVQRLGRERLASLDVACPGFAVDCLETLEEIDGLNREHFRAAGGGRFRYIPCLGERDDHLDVLAELVRRHLQGWETGRGAGEPGERLERAGARAARYPGTPVEAP